MEKKKREQKGRVIRIGETAEAKLEKLKEEGESWSKFLLRMVEGKTYWILPSIGRIFETKKEARGAAIVKAVTKGEDPESPVKVREQP